jgi:hypothetical protein
MDGQPGPLVDAARQVASILRAADAVLGREQADQRHLRADRAGIRMQEVDVGPPALVDAGVIGEQANALATDQVQAVVEEHADPRSDTALLAGARRRLAGLRLIGIGAAAADPEQDDAQGHGAANV